MELEAALEIVRRYRGPVSRAADARGGYFIIQSTGRTYSVGDLMALALQLEQRKSDAGSGGTDV